MTHPNPDLDLPRDDIPEPVGDLSAAEPGPETRPVIVELVSHWTLYHLYGKTLTDVLPMQSADILDPGLPGADLYAGPLGQAVAECPPFRVYMAEDGGVRLALEGGDRFQLWTAMQLLVIEKTMPDRR